MHIAASLVLLALAVLAYRRHLRRDGSGLLLALRLAVLGVLLLMLGGQVLRFAWTERPRRVVVLLDQSASVSAVMPDSTVARTAGGFPLPAGTRREVWSFAGGVARRPALSGPGGPPPDTMRTLLGQALAEAARSRPAAVVLLSDGQDNGELDPVTAAGRDAVPVYAVGLGAAGQGNVRVTRLDYPVSVYAGDTCPVSVRVSWAGLSARQVRVSLDGQTKMMAIGELQAEQDVEFRVRFDSPGPTVLEAAVESLPAEENHADNRRSAVLDVRRSRLRAAYLTNRPGSGTRFVLAALRADSRLDVSAFVGGSDPGALRTLAGADMFVIDAWAEQGGAAGPLAAVEARVRAGAGALVLAGPGFRPGEMLGRMLPAVAAGAPDSGVFTPVATSEGTLLPWFTPGTGVDLTAVPPFRGTAGAAVKPQVGTVWLECAETGEPLLVTGRFGRGRVAYVAGFPLWRWGFLPEQVAGGDSPLAVFLHGVARFLGEADTGRFVLETDKPGYMTGEPIRTRLLARAADGTGWEGLAVTVSIDSSAAGVPMVELGQGRYEAVLQSDAGEKTVTAAIVAGDSAVGGARARVTVVEQSVELGRLGLDAGRLRAVAAASGGRYFPPDSLPRDGSYLRPATFRRSFALDPRRSSWAYVTVALLAGLEIALRRRKGLL